MRFAKNTALIGALGAALGIALATSGVVAAEGGDVASKSAQATSHGSAVPLANAILDRWESVAIEAGVHSSTWREVLIERLSTMDVSTLKLLDSVKVGDAGAKSAYAQFTQGVRSAIMQSYMQATSGKGTAKLGSATSDLVFIPVVPCRIVDTRNASPVQGPIVVGSPRTFYFYDAGLFAYNWSTGQGGATSCPGTNFFLSTAPAAAMITVGVVSPSAAGNWIIWGGANPIPNSTALNWSGTGQILTSTIVVPGGGRAGTGPGGAILDFAVAYNGPSGSAQFTADIIGYFIENQATALDCLTTSSTTTALSTTAGVETEALATACPTGYTHTSVLCSSSSAASIFLSKTGLNGDLSCSYINNTGVAHDGIVRSRCCRVPGR